MEWLPNAIVYRELKFTNFTNYSVEGKRRRKKRGKWVGLVFENFGEFHRKIVL